MMGEDSKDSLNVALIGYGFAGKTCHAPVISSVPGLRLSYIITSDPAKVHKDWPHTTVFPTLGEALGIPAIDLIVIATPNTTHFDFVQRSLAAGKHVVVDKPFTITVAEASNLAAQAAATKKLLSVFQNRRWDGDFQTIRRLLKDRAVGEVTHFEAHCDRYRPEVKQRWREQPVPGSGIWYDLGLHLVDQVLQLFGTPETLYADLAIQRESGSTVDYFHVLLNYGKSRVIVHGESFASADLPRYVIHGALGSYVKYGVDPQEEALKSGEMPGGPGWGVDPRDGTLYTWSGGELNTTSIPTLPGNYTGYYEAVRDAILKGAPNPVSAEDALALMTILELAIQSSKARRELPFRLGRPGSA